MSGRRWSVKGHWLKRKGESREIVDEMLQKLGRVKRKSRGKINFGVLENDSMSC